MKRARVTPGTEESGLFLSTFYSQHKMPQGQRHGGREFPILASQLAKSPCCKLRIKTSTPRFSKMPVPGLPLAGAELKSVRKTLTMFILK